MGRSVCPLAIHLSAWQKGEGSQENARPSWLTGPLSVDLPRPKLDNRYRHRIHPMYVLSHPSEPTGLNS